MSGVSRRRPSTDELFGAVVELISNGSSAFKATGRRYSLCTADAEDAYQRGLEILMTKAPTADTAELRPWLHTVVKHEALAIRRQRERLLGASPESPAHADADRSPSPEEGAGERERARRSAEALGQLKPSEVQCLLLKALGYSYDEISARTGFSWTKVNRSLTEGRRRFFDRFSQIESGERCMRFAPLLSAASDGEASAEEEHSLSAHLRGCSSCRAMLRDYRTLPTRLAELLPPTLLAPFAHRGGVWSRLWESIVIGTGDRATAVGHKAQQVGEALSAQKAAAVVASTAAIAGGAAVQEHASRHHASKERGRPSAEQRQAGRSRTASIVTASGAATRPSPDAGTQESKSEPALSAGQELESAAEFSPEAAAPPVGEQVVHESLAMPSGTAMVGSGAEADGGSPRAVPSGASGGGQEFGP